MFRRNFIKTLTLSALPTSFSSVSRAALPYDCDLVIVGSGAAGLSAAISASESGLKKVLLLEKMPVIGGISGNSGGAIAVAGTEYQIRLGIKDSEELYFDDVMRFGEYANDPKLVEALVKAVKVQYDWLASHGLSPVNVMAAAGMTAPRSHIFNSNHLIRLLRKEAESRGVEIKTSSKALDLLEEDGRVTGLSVLRKRSVSQIISRKGVVLATGGFSRSQELMERFASNLYGAEVVSSIGAQGDGHLMAMRKGAHFASGENVKASFGFTRNPSTVGDFSTIYYSGAIILNRDSSRFVDESLPYKSLGDAFFERADSCAFIVFDEAIRRKQMSIRPADRVLWSPYDRGIEPSYCFRGKTIAEAADKAGLNPKKAEEEVRKYNRYVIEGHDPDFGRTALTSGYGRLRLIQESPFYIMPAIAVVVGTYCGLQTDEKARVLKENNECIKGLYAAGEIQGGVHGKNFMTGTGLGKALAFGHIAGKSAALC